VITRTRAAVPVALLVLALVGCGAESEPESAPTDGSAPASEGASSASPTETETPSPTVAAVAPATGKVIKVEGLKVRTPQGWNTTIALSLQQGAFPKGVIGTIMRVYRFPNSGLFTIDELADAEVGEFGSKGRRLEDLELDGEQVYHLRGNPERGVHSERFGTIVDDARVFVEFNFANDEEGATRDEIIQSVLATVQLG